MKRLLVFIFISIFYCLCSSVPAQDIVLRGSVNYTVETARKMAFDGLDLKLDKKFIEPYAIDENNKENKNKSGTNDQKILFMFVKLIKYQVII